MLIRNKTKVAAIKKGLFNKLKEEHAFWSYSPDSVKETVVSDEQLIAMTMRYLDLPEISQLFTIFSKEKIKKAWANLLVPEGEYLYTLNRFFAWFYFDAKRPDAYLKNLQTRQLNRIIG